MTSSLTRTTGCVLWNRIRKPRGPGRCFDGITLEAASDRPGGVVQLTLGTLAGRFALRNGSRLLNGQRSTPAWQKETSLAICAPASRPLLSTSLEHDRVP